MSSCEQHEAYQTARAVVCSAEAEQREAEEEQGAEGASIEEPDGDKSESDGESGIGEGEGGTGSTARQGKRARRQSVDRFSPENEANRPQRATAKKKQTRNAGYRDDDVDALFRGEVEKFTSSLATELARR